MMVCNWGSLSWVGGCEGMIFGVRYVVYVYEKGFVVLYDDNMGGGGVL